MLEIIVNNIYSKIVGKIDYKIINELDNELSYFVEGYMFSKAYKNGYFDGKKWHKWDGKKHLLKSDLKFLTGLLTRVKLVLDKNNVLYKVIDHREQVPYGKKIKTKNIEQRPYQKKILNDLLNINVGIVSSATGSGKSVMIAEYIANTNLKTMVYVIGVDLLYQMKEMFENVLDTEIGIIGDGIVDVKKINICTIWSAAQALGEEYSPVDDEDVSIRENKYFDDNNKIVIRKAINDAQMFIVDECHFLSTSTLQKINQSSPSAYYKIGFSGTPYRNDNSGLLLEAICGRIITEVSATELIKSGYLVQPKIHFVNIPALKNSKCDNYQSTYKEFIIENEQRNQKIIDIAIKLKNAGRKTLILVKTIKHGEILLKELSKICVVYFVRGEVDSGHRNYIKQEFLDNKIDIIIASSVYDQGIDIKNLDALVLAGSGKSSIRCLQRVGRVIRTAPGKKDAIVIDFIDNIKYLLDHSMQRIKIYLKESGFIVKVPKNVTIKKKEKKHKQLQGKKLSW